PKLRRNHVQLFAGFLTDAHQLSPTAAALLLLGNVDDQFYSREGLRKRSPLGLLPHMLANANQVGLPLRAVELCGGKLRLVEQPQLTLLLEAQRFAAAPEEPLLQPCILLGKDLHALGKLGILSPQLRVLQPERLDVPLHAPQPIAAQ